MHRDGGFSLSEVLIAIALGAIVVTLGAGSLRNFWFQRSLDAVSDEVVSRLRQSQEDAVSESAPLVFGARFTAGSANWTLFRYDPSGNGGTGACTSTQRSFDGGMFNGRVVVSAVTVTNDTGSAEHIRCRSALSDRIIFFYARGSSTGGSLVLHQPTINRTRTITVSGLTGRVSRS